MTTLTELRRLRGAQLLTQHELGAKAGLSNVAISRIETGRTRPRFSTVKKFSRGARRQAGRIDGERPMTATTGRVHIYARVSSAGTRKTVARLHTQEAACRAWAGERSLPVASVSRETWSGGDRHRPELDRLLDRLIPGDVLLVYALDQASAARRSIPRS